MTYISDDYRSTLKFVHENRPTEKPWGTTGERNAGQNVVNILRGNQQIRTVLDFGAGQGTLGHYVRSTTTGHTITWDEYEPSRGDVLDGTDYDMIVSSDVLEHVEPEYLDENIRYILAHSRVATFHHIACDPCGLTLPDGRNAHISLHNPQEWIDKFTRPGWDWMWARECLVRKRGTMRRHVELYMERVS